MRRRAVGRPRAPRILCTASWMMRGRADRRAPDEQGSARKFVWANVDIGFDQTADGFDHGNGAAFAALSQNRHSIGVAGGSLGVADRKRLGDAQAGAI